METTTALLSFLNHSVTLKKETIRMAQGEDREIWLVNGGFGTFILSNKRNFFQRSAFALELIL